MPLAAEEYSGFTSTFSIGFEESSFDELGNARQVAQRYGTDHHELVLRPDAVELLPQLVEAFDEPFADSSALPTYLVSQLASQPVKVALGEGFDELRRLLHLRRRSHRTAVALFAPAIAAGPAACRARRRRRASTTRQSASSVGPGCRRSSATTPGRRSSPTMRAPSCSARSATAAAIRLTSIGPATPRPRTPSSSLASRTWTSASTWSMTCW